MAKEQWEREYFDSSKQDFLAKIWLKKWFGGISCHMSNEQAVFYSTITESDAKFVCAPIDSWQPS